MTTTFPSQSLDYHPPSQQRERIELTASDTIAHAMPNGVRVVNLKEFNDVVSSIPSTGILARRPDDHKNGGILYLKVSELFIEKLFPLLNDNGDLDMGSSEIGAHISIVRKSMGENYPNEIDELGKEFKFTPKYVGTVKPDHDTHWEKVWFVVVEALDLEKLRENFGLTPKLFNNKHDFHITIATKKRA